nr:FAD-binding oxidoreductase [Actinomycetota bacterium]
MRVLVVGGGLAGSLLAWRLAQRPGITIDLVTGRAGRGGADATAASGGAVRAYDAWPEQCELAVASLAELLASPVLRQWAAYRETGFAYLLGNPAHADGPEGTGRSGDDAARAAERAGTERALAGIERALPG